MSTLILTLPLAPRAHHRLQLHADRRRPHGRGAMPRGRPRCCPSPRPGGEVVAVVPAPRCPGSACNCPRACRWGPGQQNPRLRSVLEGLLEDRCSTTPPSCTLPCSRAPAPAARVGGRVRPRLAARALQALEAAGRPSRAWCPNLPPAPPPAAGPSCLRWARPKSPPGAVRPRGRPGRGRAAALGRRAGLGRPDRPTDTDAAAPVVRAEPAVASAGRAHAGPPGHAAHRSQRALDAARGDWDLAQFDLASTGRTRALRKAGSAASAFLYAPQWRAARWGVGLLAAAHLVGLNAWAWQERRRWPPSKPAVRGALTQTFPPGQGGGRCPGANGARAGRAAPGRWQRLATRPGAPAGRGGRGPARRPAAQCTRICAR
jgi:general secretion pathway protein L